MLLLERLPRANGFCNPTVRPIVGFKPYPTLILTKLGPGTLALADVVMPLARTSADVSASLRSNARSGVQRADGVRGDASARSLRVTKSQQIVNAHRRRLAAD